MAEAKPLVEAGAVPGLDGRALTPSSLFQPDFRADARGNRFYRAKVFDHGNCREIDPWGSRLEDTPEA